MSDPSEQAALFAVLAEKKEGVAKPLYLHNLTFGRLIDEVIVPYEEGRPFFIDGVPVSKKELARIKVVRQSLNFPRLFSDLHHFASRPGSGKFVTAEEYPKRLDVLMRGEGVDVTQQILNAFKEGILPRLKDYVPKREELISAALTVYTQVSRATSG